MDLQKMPGAFICTETWDFTLVLKSVCDRNFLLAVGCVTCGAILTCPFDVVKNKIPVGLVPQTRCSGRYR